jgi:hypothetical protein
LPFTLKYQSARSEYFAFPNPILKDKYVFHTSLCNGPCNHLVHTNMTNAPIIKYSSSGVSILNIDHWISKIHISILNKILHLRAVPGVEFVISIPETCLLYTCIKYSDTTHDTSNNHSQSKVGTVLHTRKCLINPKICHNRTDERDPNFDTFQDIQSQNNYITAQLNVLGYRGNMLGAQF